MPARCKVTSTGSDGISAATRALILRRVLVGIPDSGAQRQPEPGESGAPPSNALIGYVQEFGDDAKHIPPRPFLVPGVADAKDAVAAGLKIAAMNAFSGKASAIDAGFVQAGFAAANAVKAKITDGPFAPLSERTIEARARRGRKGAKQYLKLLDQGTPKDVLDSLGDQALVKPLIDTGQLRQAITYVLRNRND